LAIKPDSPTKELNPTPKDQLEYPQPAALSVSAARFAKELRGALKAKPAAREAATFVKPGVRISRIRVARHLTVCVLKRWRAPALSCTQDATISAAIGKMHSTARPPHCCWPARSWSNESAQNGDVAEAGVS